MDDKCTAREVTTFFVLVNLDDEIFSNGALNRADSSAVLVFDEFWEITVRICQEKLEDFDAPPMMDGEAIPTGDDIPFEHSLDVWLGLDFIPRLKGAAKKRQESRK